MVCFFNQPLKLIDYRLSSSWRRFHVSVRTSGSPIIWITPVDGHQFSLRLLISSSKKADSNSCRCSQWHGIPSFSTAAWSSRKVPWNSIRHLQWLTLPYNLPMNRSYVVGFLYSCHEYWWVNSSLDPRRRTILSRLVMMMPVLAMNIDLYRYANDLIWNAK